MNETQEHKVLLNSFLQNAATNCQPEWLIEVSVQPLWELEFQRLLKSKTYCSWINSSASYQQDGIPPCSRGDVY